LSGKKKDRGDEQAEAMAEAEADGMADAARRMTASVHVEQRLGEWLRRWKLRSVALCGKKDRSEEEAVAMAETEADGMADAARRMTASVHVEQRLWVLGEGRTLGLGMDQEHVGCAAP